MPWNIEVNLTVESIFTGELRHIEYTAKYGEDAIIQYNGSEPELVWLRDVEIDGCKFHKGTYEYTIGGGKDLDYLRIDDSPRISYYYGEEWMLMSSCAECRKNSVSSGIFITLPASTDRARSFSLALATDADGETEVTWEGGDIVEAFPGAKKLAPGTTVWDVKEVMPNTFLVDRAPATGGVAITGDDGNAYTLGVDSEGTLEVRS